MIHSTPVVSKQQKELRKLKMCVCKEVLHSPVAEKELKFVRPDKPRMVLGNGKRVLFELIYVTEDHMGREVTLRCDSCGGKWVAKINGRYSVTPVK